MAKPATAEETDEERLERGLIELLNELRVIGTGIEVLFGLLLTVPFQSGYKQLDPLDHDVYFAALLCVAIAAALLIAP